MVIRESLLQTEEVVAVVQGVGGNLQDSLTLAVPIVLHEPSSIDASDPFSMSNLWEYVVHSRGKLEKKILRRAEMIKCNSPLCMTLMLCAIFISVGQIKEKQPEVHFSRSYAQARFVRLLQTLSIKIRFSVLE